MKASVINTNNLTLLWERKNDYMTVLKQKFWCQPHKFIIFQHRETKQIDKLAFMTKKIHSVSQWSSIWSFKIPRILTKLINQFPQPEVLSPTVQIIHALCTLKKMGLSGCKPWNQRKSCSCMSIYDKVITQESSKIAPLLQCKSHRTSDAWRSRLD